MGKSQFEKRQSKTIEEATKEVAEVLATPDAQLPQVGYDIYTSNGGQSYGVAEIQYDPETKQAKVVDTFTISRLIALQYANQKQALGILKKKILKTK